MRAYHCRNIVKYIVTSIALPLQTTMRANEGPGDPLTDFHTFAFTDTTRTCTALPLPSDLVTVGFHTNAKENTKQQTSSSGLSHTGGERPQA